MTSFYLSFYFAALAVWVFRGICLIKALSFTPHVRPAKGPFSPEKVSVIIPMKNEESNAQACLEHFLAQDHPHLEIIVINDNSTDKTGSILKSLPVTVVTNTTPTPPGWTGKNFAIHQGITKATGDWLLFTDADTRHEKSSVSAALAHAHAHQLELLTLLPRCLAESFMENLVQPSAMAFMGLWFPIRKLNDPDSPMHFANGQYLLIHRPLYEKIGRHEAVKDAFLEDFAIMKKAKALKAKTQVGMGREIYGTRMYDSLDTIWKGWRRIYQHSFENRPLPLLARAVATTLFSVLTFLLFIPLTIQFLSQPNAYFPAWALAAALLLLIEMIMILTYGIVRAKKIYSPLHPIAALILAGILFDGFWMALTKKKTVWR